MRKNNKLVDYYLMLYVHAGYNLEPELPTEAIWADLTVKFDKYEYNLSAKSKE